MRARDVAVMAWAVTVAWGCESPRCDTSMGYVPDDIVRTSEPLRCPSGSRLLGIVEPRPLSTNVSPGTLVVLDFYLGTADFRAVDRRVRGYVDEAEVTLGDGTPTTFRSTWRTRGSDYTSQLVVAELSPEQEWTPGVTRVSTSDLEGAFAFHVGDDAAPFVKRLARMEAASSSGARTFELVLSEPLELAGGVRVQTHDGVDVPFTWVLSEDPAKPTYLTFSREDAEQVEQGFELSFAPSVVSSRSGRPVQWSSPEFGIDAPATDASVEGLGVDEGGAFVRVGPSGGGAVVFVDAVGGGR